MSVLQGVRFAHLTQAFPLAPPPPRGWAASVLDRRAGLARKSAFKTRPGVPPDPPLGARVGAGGRQEASSPRPTVVPNDVPPSRVQKRNTAHRNTDSVVSSTPRTVRGTLVRGSPWERASRSVEGTWPLEKQTGKCGSLPVASVFLPSAASRRRKSRQRLRRCFAPPRDPRRSLMSGSRLPLFAAPRLRSPCPCSFPGVF